MHRAICNINDDGNEQKVYDIVLKLSSDDAENLRSIITNKIRKISKVQSTLTMMVIEEQEKL